MKWNRIRQGTRAKRTYASPFFLLSLVFNIRRCRFHLVKKKKKDEEHENK